MEASHFQIEEVGSGAAQEILFVSNAQSLARFQHADGIWRRAIGMRIVAADHEFAAADSLHYIGQGRIISAERKIETAKTLVRALLGDRSCSGPSVVG